MSSKTIQIMPFTQIIAFKSYLDNLGKTLKLHLKLVTFHKTVHGPQKRSVHYA